MSSHISPVSELFIAITASEPHNQQIKMCAMCDEHGGDSMENGLELVSDAWHIHCGS